MKPLLQTILKLKKKVQSKLFVKNSAWTLLGFGVRIGIKSVYFILIARELGPTEYGKFIAIIALVSILVPFSSWGSGNILVKHVSRDKSKFNEYWGAALSTTLISGTVLCCIVILIYGLFLPSNISVYSVIAISTADLIFGRIVDVSIMAFLAFEKMKKMTSLQIISSILLMLFAIVQLLLPARPTVESWSFYYLFSFIIIALISFWFVSRDLGWGVMNPLPIWNEFGEGFLFSIGISSQSFYNDFDKTMLSKLNGEAVAGIYSAAYKIINLLFVPVYSLMYAAYPRFFKFGEKGIKYSTRWAIKLLFISIGYSFLTLPVIFMISKFIILILGSEYSETATALIWLCPLVFLKSAHCFPADALTGSGKQSIRSVVQIIVAVINVGINLYLIPIYGWRGAAVASIISDSILGILLWILIIYQIKKNE